MSDLGSPLCRPFLSGSHRSELIGGVGGVGVTSVVADTKVFRKLVEIQQ